MEQAGIMIYPQKCETSQKVMDDLNAQFRIKKKEGERHPCLHIWSQASICNQDQNHGRNGLIRTNFLNLS